MTALFIIGLIVLFFVFLLSLRATVIVRYREEPSICLRVLFFKIPLLPAKKKKGSFSMGRRKAEKIKQKLKAKKKKKAENAREKKKAKAEKKEAPKKSMSEILDFLRLITALISVAVKKFCKHIRIHVKRFRMTVATSDAATTAVAYGAVTGLFSVLLPAMESVKQVSFPKNGKLDIQTDFLGDTPTFDLELSVSLRVWHVFDIAFGLLGTWIRKKVKELARRDTSPSNVSAESPSNETPVKKTTE